MVHRTGDDERSDATHLAGVRLTAEERQVIAESQAGPGHSLAGPEPTSSNRLEMRAAVLRQLCLEKRAELWLRGVKVTGRLNLAGVRLDRSLRFFDCEFTEPIDLTGARAVETIEFTQCELRSLHADRLSVQGDLVLERVRNHGSISLIGGRLGGSLRCSGSEFVKPGGTAFNGRSLMVEVSALFDEHFRVEGEVVLASARIKGTLDFGTASCRNAGATSIDATYLALGGELLCADGFSSEGEVCLRWAQVGAVDARNGSFSNPAGTALMWEGIRVSTGLFLNEGFRAEGLVVLRGARVAGTLSATKGRFLVPPAQEKAIDAEFIEAAEVQLDHGFHATGRVSLNGSKVTGRLNCDGGEFSNPDGVALSASGLDCAGDVRLGHGLVAAGEVQLVGTKIGRELNCTRGTFRNPGHIALHANGLVCASLFLNETFHAVGAVQLMGVRITIQLNCTGGTFENADGTALQANGLVCGGSLYLNETHAIGTVDLTGTRITTQLNCSKAAFQNDNGTALNASGLVTEGDVYLNHGFKATGKVRLIEATVGRQLNCKAGRFETLSARGLKVGGLFDWRPSATPTGEVDVSFADVDQLWDEPRSWPTDGKTKLSGFTFHSLGGSTKIEARKEWLRNAESYAPNVYEQLIRIYRRDGQEDDAQNIAIATERERRRRGNMPLVQKLWSVFLDVSVSYGYRVNRVLYPILILGVVFSVVFNIAQDNEIMKPIAASGRASPPEADTCTPDYPRFIPPAYSFELLFPVVNLRQVSYWLPSPSASRPWGLLLLVYVWIAIVLGWALGIAVAAGIGHQLSQRR
jgi:hypothetical protein